MSRDMRGLLKIAREQGYEVRMAGKHRKVYHQGEVVLVLSLTPRARSATQKVEADLRRVGVRFPWRPQRERTDAPQTQQEERTMVTIETQNGSAHQTEEVRPHRAPLGARPATVDGPGRGPVTPDAEVAALLGEGTATAAATTTEQPTKVCARCRVEDEAVGDPRQGRRPLSDFYKNRSAKDGLSYYCAVHNRRKAMPAPAPTPDTPPAPTVSVTPDLHRADAPALDGADLFEMMAALERRMGDMESRLMPGILRRLTALEEIPPAPVPVAPPAPAAPPDALRAAGLAARLMEHMHDVCLLAENAARLHMLVTGGGLLREEAALLTQHGTAALARQLYTEGPDTTTDNDESTEV